MYKCAVQLSERLMKFTFTIWLARSFALLTERVQNEAAAPEATEFRRHFINSIEMEQMYKHFIYFSPSNVHYQQLHLNLICDCHRKKHGFGFDEFLPT